MSAEAAEVIAAHTDWSQFATKHDLSQLESRPDTVDGGDFPDLPGPAGRVGSCSHGYGHCLFLVCSWDRPPARVPHPFSWLTPFLGPG